MSKPWYLYVLMCSDGTLYTGVTTNIARRLHEHNHTRKGAKYTRCRRPVRIIAARMFADKSTAMSEEYTFKRFSHARKIVAYQRWGPYAP